MEPTLIPPSLNTLDDFLEAGPYVGYVYSYPHKTSYREFLKDRNVGDIWRREPRDALFLYVHVPFCEMRCGFCNLFTYSQPDRSLPDDYLRALQRQMETIQAQLGDARFARLAIGGGTPTYLDSRQLDALFDIIHTAANGDEQGIPSSIETSPTTIDSVKAGQLKQHGVNRISMGVQSWDAGDVGRMGRPQRETDVELAIQVIRDADFDTLNLDLIYGADGQSTDSWRTTIKRTLAYRPEEIYLYPLYIRPLTGLASRPLRGDPRLRLYQAGRDLLLEQGYEQVSMRMFQLPRQMESAPVYCCQEDGMIGLGCGARSYTRSVHYADSFAVGQSSILQIIEQYIEQNPTDWATASRGFELNDEEQRRRYLIISLLTAGGLETSPYVERFGASPLEHFPELSELLDRELATHATSTLRLTSRGLAWSDSIGPWLYSGDVRRRMEEFSWQ